MELPTIFNSNSQRYDIIADNNDTNVSPAPQKGLRFKYNRYMKAVGLTGMFLSCLLFMVAYLGDSSKLQLGFVLERSTPYKQVVHPDIPTGLWGKVSKPYPTGAFWTNLVVKSGDGPVGVLPYAVKVLETGIQVSYGPTRRVVTQHFVSDPFNVDLEISATEGYVSRSVESYDNSSVTMTYQTVTGNGYKTHLVKGSPFITVVYDHTTPIISSDIMNIVSIEPHMIKDATGVHYVVTLGNYQKWLVYCSETVGFSWKDNKLIASNSITGFVRVAILPMANAVNAYDALLKHVDVYPTGAVWTFNFVSNTNVEVEIQYTTVGTGNGLLMLALPHHFPIMTVPDIDVDIPSLAMQSIYQPIYSIKGKMKAVIGSKWRLKYDLVNVGWNFVPSDKLTNSQMDEIAKHLIIDVAEILPNVSDTYALGKQLGRMSRLALIADEFGIANVRQQAITKLEKSLTPWLAGTNSNPLVYDKTWGGLVSQHSLENFVNDFGSGWYSDHHFHYGYFIYAFATLVKLDPQYFGIYRSAIENFVRDICNPDPTDTDYPFYRHKDLFDGHSWASGLFQQGNGKGQESSSESINAYYSSYLYGLATSNAELTRMSHIMLSMEVHSTKVYWHMTDDSVPEIYDEVFAANRMLGNIGAIDITSSTWFGNKYEFVHGINIMPLTPITAVLLDQQYVKQEWPVLGSRLNTPPVVVDEKIRKCSNNPKCAALGLLGDCCPNTEDVFLQCCNSTAESLGFDVISNEFKSYIYIDQAVIDREAAWANILSLPSFGQGGSKSNTLYWAATRSAPPLNYSVQPASPNFDQLIPKSCSENSACNIAGLQGDCCPLDNGVSLGCCSRAITLTPW